MKKYSTHSFFLFFFLNASYAAGPNDKGLEITDDDTGVVRIFQNSSTEISGRSGSGTLITPDSGDIDKTRFILTSAHCLVPREWRPEQDNFDSFKEFHQDLRISVTWHREQPWYKEEREDIISLNKVILHPDFARQKNPVDLALLVLDAPIEGKRPFRINQEIHPPLEECSFFACGFGTTGNYNNFTFTVENDRKLRRVPVNCDFSPHLEFPGAPIETWYGNKQYYSAGTLYRSYYMHDEWCTDLATKNKALRRMNNLPPSDGFPMTGDSGGALFDSNTRKLFGITTMGTEIPSLNLDELDSEESPAHGDPCKAIFPQCLYTPITPTITDWILENITK